MCRVSTCLSVPGTRAVHYGTNLNCKHIPINNTTVVKQTSVPGYKHMYSALCKVLTSPTHVWCMNPGEQVATAHAQ